MREITDVIKEKEAQLTRINEELAALRLALRLLTEESGENSGGRSGSRDEPKATMGRVKSFP
jgi:hypothetical protein